MALHLAPGVADLAILAVLFGAGASSSRRIRRAGALSAVLGSVAAVAYLVLAFDLIANTVDAALTLSTTFGGILATLGLSWTVGLLSRSVRRAREGQSLRAEAERERARAQRELDTVEERNRIARDMHDVVAHSLAVVIAQADGARYLGAASPEQTDAALLTISSVARDALGDVRVLLAQLRHSQSDGPQPEARDLPALLERVGGRCAGAVRGSRSISTRSRGRPDSRSTASRRRRPRTPSGTAAPGARSTWRCGGRRGGGPHRAERALLRRRVPRTARGGARSRGDARARRARRRRPHGRTRRRGLRRRRPPARPRDVTDPDHRGSLDPPPARPVASGGRPA